MNCSCHNCTNMRREPIVRVGVGVFVFKNGGFLMGCRKSSHGSGSWSIPGGHIEVGESLELAAAREVYEEAGVWVKNLRFGAITNDIFTEENKHYITIWMLSDWREGDPINYKSTSFSDLGWYDFDSLPKPPFKPWEQLTRSEYFEQIK